MPREVQNNDGPAGSEVFHQWADGVGVACRGPRQRDTEQFNQ